MYSVAGVAYSKDSMHICNQPSRQVYLSARAKCSSGMVTGSPAPISLVMSNNGGCQVSFHSNAHQAVSCFGLKKKCKLFMIYLGEK